MHSQSILVIMHSTKERKKYLKFTEIKFSEIEYRKRKYFEVNFKNTSYCDLLHSIKVRSMNEQL